MKLSVKGLALSCGLLWGLVMLLSGVCNLLWGYGEAFLRIVDSIYPGYQYGTGFGSVVVGTLYGLVDGAIAGAVLAWLYNRFSR